MANDQDDRQGDGWQEYQRLVLAELKRFNSWLNEIDKRLNAIDTRLVVQETKAGIWGAIGGAAAIAVILFMKYLFTGSLR